MSIENDNLPNAEGHNEKKLDENFNSVPDLNSGEETIGNAPLQSNAEAFSEGIKELPEDKLESIVEGIPPDILDVAADVDTTSDVRNAIVDKDIVDSSNQDSIVNPTDVTTGKAPIQLDIEPAADAFTEEVDQLPKEKALDIETGIPDELRDTKEEVELLKETKTGDNDAIKTYKQTTDEPSSPNITEVPNMLHKDLPIESIDSSNSKSDLNQESQKDFDESADDDQAENVDEEKDGEDSKVPLKDYDDMSLGDMVTEAADLIQSYSVLVLRDAFNGLRDAFRKKSDEDENEAKEKFIATGGSEIDFKNENRHRTPFYDLYTDYKTQIDKHYKAKEAEQEENLKERKAIIEELKALYTAPAENNSKIFSTFRELKTRWHNAGRIPKAESSNIFKTYYFHLDNFHEFLNMNQELRVMDYEHNLSIRKNIIAIAKKLIQEENVQKALNDLQYLHRMWKEQGVPVAEEFRESTWQEFKDISSKIHDRKTELNAKLAEKQQENLDKKNDVIAKIDALLEQDAPKTHNHWQKKIKEMKSLRDEFFALGRVPKEDNQPTWDKFKEASRKFNKEKNTFYKSLKEEQMLNLEKKRELVALANEHKESKNWNDSVNMVKKIQSEWKKIGHVPRKYSDKIWKEFSDANNLFFERYKNRNNEKLDKQKENLQLKKDFLVEMDNAIKPTDNNELIEWLNQKRIQWSSIGFVPNGKQDISKEFNKLIDKILKDSGLSQDAVEKAQWDSQIAQIKSSLDADMLKELKYDIRKRMDEVQKEVSQLQTNLAFFSNADDSNPLFKNAIQNIEDKVGELKSLSNKNDDLKMINLQALAENQENDKASANETQELGDEEGKER